MVKYDLETSIDYVLKETGAKYVYYAGHSQGTLTLFSKLSEDAKFASKIKQFHALAPVGTVKNVTGFLRYISDHFYYEIDVMLDLFGRNQFLPESGFLHAFAEKYCKDVSNFNINGNSFTRSLLTMLVKMSSLLSVALTAIR